jgi:MOSC domain-containing protein YiiM
MQGKVLKLFITSDDGKKKRESVERIELNNEGILHDKFYAQNIQRSVLLTSRESYIMASNKDIEIDYGSLGENILLDVNPYSLDAGKRLFIGNVELEITQSCTLCKGLSTLNSKLPKLLKDDRGVFAKVISGKGIINIGDIVRF